MRPHLFISAGSLSLIVNTVVGSGVASAQGYCYLLDADGQVINLEHLCQSGNPPAPAQPEPPEAATDQGEGSASSSPTVRSYTIIGPVVQPESGGESPATDPQPLPTPDVPAASPLDSMDASDGSAVPLGEPSTTQIRTLRTPDSTITVIDRPDREVNGIILQGRDETIIGPPSLESSSPAESASPATAE